MPGENEKKLGLPALIGMVVGSMIGAGIFSLPRTFGSATGVVGALIAWAIAGVGMYTLARIFQILAERKPDLDAGVFAYAKAGFGNYAGFLAAFGYWIGSCIGNVSYWILIKSTLGAYFPFFGDGNTISAIAVASIGIWAFHFLILRGVQQAAVINAVVTVAKIIPILVFIVILLVAFNADLFRANLWGTYSNAGLLEQVRLTMLVTVFVFLGIEGASVYSRYAKKRSHVGAATLIGFAMVLSLMVLVSLLPYGVMEQGEIAALRQPSLAGVLEHVVGRWGAVLVSLGLLVSVLGAYLAWSLICAEVLYAAARNDDMPKIFARKNANDVPASALWLSNAVVQLFVISTYWSSDAFALMLNLTSVMSLIPYLLVAGFGLSVARRGGIQSPEGTRRRDLTLAGVAVVYTAFMVLAGGMKYMLLSALLYAPGTALYFWARLEKKRRVFQGYEMILFAVACAGSLAAAIALGTGWIAL
ncbi:basic amino acid/polyamine antiporter [Diaphorobacter aerolatus]|uniref:Amino acid permease n=1 Tax=Diaphorobacter aerolatus TaxID=1288495 RepID=A0A7H0GL51_9BURK|nr:basic amino acid/polyamine antiporter [Diaphorobacter aerolatus]QNP49017.1 amino acid permease [Diaphorobacter aerolatus]